MKKILFLVDVRDWAYDYQAKKWQSMLSKEYDIDILYLKDYPVGSFSTEYSYVNRLYLNSKKTNLKNDKNLLYHVSGYVDKPLAPVFDHNDYQGIVFFYYRAPGDKRLISTEFPMEKVIICINNEKWTKYGSENEYRFFMDGAAAVGCCNQNVLDHFKKHTRNTKRLSQAISKSFINKNYFTNRSIKRVGFCGNPKNVLKNYDNIVKGCRIAGKKLYTASKLNQSELIDWYNKMDLIVCASESEGGPMCVLEAGGMGVPVLTTRVGLAREIINEHTGMFLKNSSPRDISKSIKYLDRNPLIRQYYAKNLQEEISKNWTYEARIDEIRSILKML